MLKIFQPSIGNIFLGHDRTYIDGQLIVPKSLTTSVLQSGNEFLHFLGHSNIEIKVLKRNDGLGAAIDFGKFLSIIAFFPVKICFDIPDINRSMLYLPSFQGKIQVMFE